ncbi:MAG: hypothetical protein AAF743_11595, partial [Planctomycetota bacterium]
GKGSVSFPDYPDLPDVALEGLTIRRDGVSIDDFAVNFGEGDAEPEAHPPVAALTFPTPTEEPQRPLLIVPGIVGTFPKANDDSNKDAYRDWLLQRGVHPDTMEAEQLLRVNDDLFLSLQNSGYTADQDLFVVSYDWRVPPAPIDGSIDGVIDGVTAQSAVDLVFETGVDYMGFFLDRAADAWEAEHGERPDSVDIIAHSTGGLVTRGYIQSTARGDTYVDTDDRLQSLPEINHFVSVGVPHRGASKAWGPINNDFSVDVSFALVLSKVLNAPYQKLLDGSANEILGPSGVSGGDDNITLDKIRDDDGNPSPKKFIDLYLPTARALLATYPFLKNGGSFIDINDDPNLRNNIALDLNAGADLGSGLDPNAFLDRITGQFTVIAGLDQETPTFSDRSVGDALRTEVLPNRTTQINPNPLTIFRMEDYTPSRPMPGDAFFDDVFVSDNGDGTVPLASSIDQFLGDDRAEVLLYVETGLVNQLFPPESPADNVTIRLADGPPDHLNLLVDGQSRRDIIRAVGAEPPFLVQRVFYTEQVLNIIGAVNVDPVSAVVNAPDGTPLVGVDPQGEPVVADGTRYVGGTDGFGLIFDSAVEPGDELSVDLTAIDDGGPYRVGIAQTNGGIGGGEFVDTLDAGESVTEPVSFTRIFEELRNTIAGLIEIDGLTITGTGINVDFTGAGPLLTGTLGIAGTDAALLPDRTTEELDGFATVGAFDASFNLLTAAISFEANDATVTIPDIVTAQADTIAFNLDPDDTSTDAILASFTGVNI